jgi:uncharacterized membrane protein YphA (DoxX/SURF4 family)
MNPFSDVWAFLQRDTWPVYLLWLMLLCAGAAAAYGWRINPTQRNARTLWLCAARIMLGTMWWQQILWKLPPHYTDQPGVPYTGLIYWMGEMVHHAAIPLQARLVEQVVLPNFQLFALLVFLTEAAVGGSLILGLFTRAGAFLGGLMAVNLWLGLYRSPAEWPWTYFFLILLQFTFAGVRSGRQLGLDALLARSARMGDAARGPVARFVRLMT